MTLSFVIPTYNAEEYLERCLKSIKDQGEQVEVLVVDGGSTDRTLEIAQKYHYKILPNPDKIAEFGVKKGILATNTDLVVVFAADNELTPNNWVKGVIRTFEENPISALWGGILGDEKPINQYFELIQNDPLCWFLKPPHVWGANGLVYRTKDIKPIFAGEGYIGDNDAFQTLVEQGKGIMFEKRFAVIHHHCKSIRHCISKWWRNHTEHYLPFKDKRNMRWLGKGFYFKVVLWFIYVALLAFSHSVYLAIRDRNKAWLYHFPLSFSQMMIYLIARLR